MSVMDGTEAVAALLHQNFARSVHSGTILHTVRDLLATVKADRLTYSSAEAAAAFLENRFAQWPDPPAKVGDARLLAFRGVKEAEILSVPAAFEPERAYVRVPGFSEVAMNGSQYLTDAHGLGIHRLNDGSLAIWRLLEEPMRLCDICDVLFEAFSGTPRKTIETDTERTLRSFVEARLVEAPGTP